MENQPSARLAYTKHRYISTIYRNAGLWQVKRLGL